MIANIFHLVALALSNPIKELHYDVFVLGATPAGIAAAIAASRTGAQRVMIAESSKWIGGMMSGGLGCTDKVGKSSYGGIAHEFLNRTQTFYGGAARPRLPHCTSNASFEPHVATLVFEAMLREANVTVAVNRELLQVNKSAGNVLENVLLRTNSLNLIESIKATVFIDATYEGDLMAQAGVSFAVGREGTSVYDEPIAGRRPLIPGACYGFHANVNPFGPDGKVLPMVWPGPLQKQGGGDSKVMAYNYRLCFTNSTNKNLRAEITRPPDYDPEFWVGE